jgi:hypothetical protein
LLRVLLKRLDPLLGLGSSLGLPVQQSPDDPRSGVALGRVEVVDLVDDFGR